MVSVDDPHYYKCFLALEIGFFFNLDILKVSLFTTDAVIPFWELISRDSTLSLKYLNQLYKFLRWNLMVFIIKGLRTIVFIFIVIFHNVSADMSPGLLLVFFELGNLHGTSNYVLYWIQGGRLLWFR